MYLILFWLSFPYSWDHWRWEGFVSRTSTNVICSFTTPSQNGNQLASGHGYDSRTRYRGTTRSAKPQNGRLARQDWRLQGKMDTFQDKLTSLKEHQQPANDSPTQPPEKPMETQECIIPGWNRQTSDSFIQTCMPYAWGTAKVVDKDLQIRPRFHQPSKGCSTDQGPC